MPKLSSYSQVTPLITDTIPITSGGATHNIPLSSLPKGATKTVATAASGFVADYICAGASDEVNINAAITAVSGAGGGIVHVKAGTYIIHASINPKNNVILQGEGPGVTIFKQDNNVNIHVITDINGMSNVLMRDFEVDGNKANNATATGHNIRIGHQSALIRCVNVWSHDSPTHGFITAYDSSLQQDFVSFTNCHSYNNGVSANGSGFYFNGNAIVETINCVAYGNQLDGMQWKTSNHLEIANIVSHDNGRYGFFAVDGHANVANISSYNNTQFGFYVQGGGVFDPTNNSTVNLSNSNVYFNNRTGIRLEDADGCGLANVRCYNNGQDGTTAAGIHLTSSASNTSNRHRIVGCTLYDDQGSPTQDYGIWGSGAGAVDKNIIYANEIYGNSTTPVRQDTWGINNIYSTANNITS